MCEDMEEVAREQIAAESEILCSADEFGGTFRLNFGLIGIPFQEAETRVTIQRVQHEQG